MAFVPEERGVEQLARQIKVTGRAYPLFQIALLILDKAERIPSSSPRKNPKASRNHFSSWRSMSLRGRARKKPLRTF
ncbi:MAG: hypothetical protein WDN00_12120 [Limisphaerales bacterium]